MTLGELREQLLALGSRQLAMRAQFMGDDGRTAEIEYLTTEDGQSPGQNARKQLFLCGEFRNRGQPR